MNILNLAEVQGFFLFKKVVKTSWHEVVMTSLRAVKVCRLTKFAAVRCNDIIHVMLPWHHTACRTNAAALPHTRARIKHAPELHMGAT